MGIDYFSMSMTDNSANNKRIAKNTLLLYFRMLFMMVISLFTSRVILNTLGIEDYGINNVVGGVVAMFGFINAAMSTSTQRYITFELGKNNFQQLQKVFSTSINIHILISLLILFLGETVGLWFLYHKMVIPIDRMDAALWVYQLSILSTMIGIMSVPYNAIIVAHEKMSAFAYISVFEVILKLLIVYLLFIGHFDKLKLYAVLFFCVQLIIRFIYGGYCNRHFAESKYHWIWDKPLFKEMTSFAGWNLWGNCASIAFTQGLNILLNIFFGPAINAARGIAVQVQGAITQFSANFQMALNPQITKSYAADDLQNMHILIFRSSKFTFFLLLLLSMPVMIETKTILTVWLKIVPDYTVDFIRLMLCVSIIDSVANPLMISVAATGKVKIYQSVIGGILLAILPISYIVLKLGGNPVSVFIVHLCVCIVAFTVRLFIIRPLIQLPLVRYTNQVILRCMGVALLASIPPILTYLVLYQTTFAFFAVCLICVLSTMSAVYWLGFNKAEQQFIYSKTIAFYHKFKK